MQNIASEDNDKAAPPQEGSSTARLEAFSDGVFAVAITLLVFNIKLPPFGDVPNPVHSLTDITTFMVDQIPSYLAYLLSFVVIGITWIDHHVLFNYIKRVDRILLGLNLMLLLTAALVPFTASFLAVNLQAGVGGQQLAAVIYSGTLFVQGIFFNAIWRYASHNYRLLDRTADPRQVANLTRRDMIWPLIFLVSIAISFFSVEASLLIYIGLPLVYFLPTAADRFGK